MDQIENRENTYHFDNWEEAWHIQRKDWKDREDMKGMKVEDRDKEEEELALEMDQGARIKKE